MSILKALTKTVVDSYVLPGTAMGAEILWLYSIQWKNQISTWAVALVWFAFSQAHIHGAEQFSSNRSVNEQESTM